jgi:hypothetical protein
MNVSWVQTLSHRHNYGTNATVSVKKKKKIPTIISVLRLDLAGEIIYCPSIRGLL